MTKNLLLIACSLLIGYTCSSQSTGNSPVMFYNLWGFPGNTCIPNRGDALRAILQEIGPDILMVCELNDSSGVTTILQGALNVNGISKYAAASYVPNGSSTNSLQNMMFYDSTKYTLVEQNQIHTGLRDINHYRIYAKDTGLASHNDTLFLNLYVCHLKAGGTSGNQAQRKQEVDSLRAWSRGFPDGEAHLLAGDLNVYSCEDSAYQCLMDSFPCDFEDPIQACGAWSNDSTYSSIHTQSTRCTGMCGGASGGVDDRFDQILVSNNMLSGYHGIQADSSSYEAFGNPGNLFNSCLDSPSSNPNLPPAVVSSLYNMSDHFPVVMDLEVTFPTIPVTLENAATQGWQLGIQNPVQDQLRVFLTDEISGSLEWTILTSWGAILTTGEWEFNSGKNRMTVPTQELASGTYFFRVLDRQKSRTAVRGFHVWR